MGDESKLEILLLFDFPMDQRLNDGPQEFFGNDVHDLRAHLIEDTLYNRLDKRRIRRRELGWIGRLWRVDRSVL
jgi:hypothetical protein